MANSGSRPKAARLRAERLELRITAAQKALIEHAAALQGRSMTDFVLAAVQDAASHVIDDQQRLTLSVNDGRAFVEALVSPVPLGGDLAEAVRNLKP